MQKIGVSCEALALGQTDENHEFVDTADCSLFLTGNVKV